jgi:hypothetical protein
VRASTPVVVQREREVERRLPAERGQERVGRSRSMMAVERRRSSGST